MWFSPVSSSNKTDHHYICEILLHVELNIINHNRKLYLQAFNCVTSNVQKIATVLIHVKTMH